MVTKHSWFDLGVKLAHEEKTQGFCQISQGPFSRDFVAFFVSLQLEHENPHHLLAAYFFPTLELFADGGFSAIFPSWQLATKRTSLVKYGFIQPGMITKHMTCSQDAREDYIYIYLYRCTSLINTIHREEASSQQGFRLRHVAERHTAMHLFTTIHMYIRS